jgi:hypothetical protein
MKQQYGYVGLYGILLLAIFIVCISKLVVGFSMFQQYTVRAEIEKLQALCIYLQQQALVSNKPLELKFDIINRRYASGEIKNILPIGVMFDFMPNVKGSPGVEYAPVVKAITFADNRIIFYPDGTISAGTLYLTDSKKTLLYALTSGVGATSYIRSYRYHQGAWAILS